MGMHEKEGYNVNQYPHKLLLNTDAVVGIIIYSPVLYS